MNGKTAWIIGGDRDCDVVADVPSVSRRHCRLARNPDGTFTVEDLGSTNGTYVNGRRIEGVTPVRREDEVTLGLKVVMPWPDLSPAVPPPAPAPAPAPDGTRVVRVGRDPDNDFVIGRGEVSGRHARVSIGPGGKEGFVEDLGSVNGTAVGDPSRRAPRSALLPGDVIFFGPVSVPASVFFNNPQAAGLDAVPELVYSGAMITVGRDPGCDRVIDNPVVSSRHARLLRAGGSLVIEDLGSSNGTFVNGRRVQTTAVVTPGDLIGLGSYTLRLVDGSVVMLPPPGAVTGRFDLPAAPPAVPAAAPVGAGPWAPPAVAALGLFTQASLLAGLVVAAAGFSQAAGLFGLALASFWVGLTTSVFLRPNVAAWRPGGSAGWSPGVELAASLGLAAVVDMLLCLWVWLAASFKIPFESGWPAVLGVLWLTALTGSGAGAALVRSAGRPSFALATGAGLLMLLVLSVCPAQTMSAFGPVGRLAAGATPTRWSSEALFLLSMGEKADDPAGDPVERFFPAGNDRSGIPACATALLAMLGGLVYADAVIALYPTGRSRPVGPGSR